MSAYPSNRPLPQTAHVGVYQPCTCATCEDPSKRWFQCAKIHERWIAEYACTPAVELVDDDGITYTLDHVPAQANLDAIRAKHPGATLVF